MLLWRIYIPLGECQQYARFRYFDWLLFTVISLTCAKTAGKAVCRCFASWFFAYVGEVTDSSQIKTVNQLLTSFDWRIWLAFFIWLWIVTLEKTYLSKIRSTQSDSIREEHEVENALLSQVENPPSKHSSWLENAWFTGVFLKLRMKIDFSAAPSECRIM